MKRLFNRQNLPWFIVAVLVIVLGVILFAKRGGDAPAADNSGGVVQDNSGRRVTAWMDPMYSQGPPHTTRSNKPGRALDCGMKLVALYADDAPASGTATSTVSGYSNVSLPPARQQLIGVKLAKAEFRTLGGGTRTVGRVTVDERRTAQIHTKFEGVVEALYVNFTGQTVRRGDPLLSVYSPDLLATQQELILAERSKTGLTKTLVDAARHRLLLWDMSAGDIDRVIRTGQPVRAVTLRSPAGGVVLAKTAVLGARVMPADTLYQIADLSSVWVLADVYESELSSIRAGQPAQVTLGSTGQTWTGRVTFVSPTIEEATRTAKVRIELANPGGALKPDMFADVILQRSAPPVVAVPDSAVMQTGTRSIVFVQTAPGQFAPRQVQTGAKSGGFYEIRSGVTAGETVVADANFLVDSESRLKSAISGMNSSDAMANMPGMSGGEKR